MKSCIVTACGSVGTVVRASDKQLEIVAEIPAAALSSATMANIFANIASVTKQYNLVPE